MIARAPAELSTTSEAADFVRFCYRRRRVGWPELYDEMCSVASRGIFQGWGAVELSERGVGFSLEEMPRLARLVLRILDEDVERRPTRVVAVRRDADPAPERPETSPLPVLVAVAN
jgi:hypothetical protein